MIASKGVNLTRKSSWKLLEGKKVEKQKRGFIVAMMIVGSAFDRLCPYYRQCVRAIIAYTELTEILLEM
jgi:hypothetical protein